MKLRLIVHNVGVNNAPLNAGNGASKCARGQSSKSIAADVILR